MRHYLLLILCLLILSTHDAYAADASECTSDKAMKVEMLPNINQWDDFYTAYKNYGACDDGSIAEGFSESAADLLANHWGQVGAFMALAAKDQGFKYFIIGHIDETDDLDDINRIVSNARDLCPSDAERLCKAIEVQATHPDISGWLWLYADRLKTEGGGHAIYIPEDDVFAIGDLTGERKDDLAVAFTLSGMHTAGDSSRYVAVFTKMPVNDGEEYEYCCMYQISTKGNAADEKIQIQNGEIELSSPSLRLKVVGTNLIEEPEHKGAP